MIVSRFERVPDSASRCVDELESLTRLTYLGGCYTILCSVLFSLYTSF